MPRGEFSVDDLGAFLTSEQAWAGLAVDEQGPALAMVFEFRHYPAKTVINIMAIGGRDLGQVAMTFWLQFLAWAKESGRSGDRGECPRRWPGCSRTSASSTHTTL